MTLSGTWIRTRSTLNGAGTKLRRKQVTMTRGRGDAQRCRVAVKRVATIGTALGLSALLYLAEPTTAGQKYRASICMRLKTNSTCGIQGNGGG